MKLVAWAPPGMLAPMELLAAKVPVGQVTERVWLEALANRVTEMALKENDKAFLSEMCNEMGLPPESSPHLAGQAMLLDNWGLRTQFSCAVIDQNPFPATVTESDPDAEEAISETDLSMWADLAVSMGNESSLA